VNSAIRVDAASSRSCIFSGCAALVRQANRCFARSRFGNRDSSSSMVCSISHEGNQTAAIYNIFDGCLASCLSNDSDNPGCRKHQALKPGCSRQQLTGALNRAVRGDCPPADAGTTVVVFAALLHFIQVQNMRAFTNRRGSRAHLAVGALAGQSSCRPTRVCCVRSSCRRRYKRRIQLFGHVNEQSGFLPQPVGL